MRASLADEITQFYVGSRIVGAETKLAETAIEIGLRDRRRDQAHIAETGELELGRLTITGNGKSDCHNRNQAQDHVHPN